MEFTGKMTISNVARELEKIDPRFNITISATDITASFKNMVITGKNITELALKIEATINVLSSMKKTDK
jgi:hypothetical protein